MKITQTEPHYYSTLAMLHEELRPRTYLEIGVATGESIVLSRPGTICVGVDPEPLPGGAPGKMPSRAQIFAETSDAFFEKRSLPEVFSGAPLDLVFIDGMHLFEYALRDFMNVEANSHAGTVVAVHDCVPYLEVTTARERTTDAWTGDIWKLVVCLKEHRPDLDVLIVDSPPTGLCLISGLDRASSVLADSYDQLLEHYVPQPWSTYADDFADAFQAWSVPVGEALDRVSHLRREGWASTVLRLQSLSEAQASAEVRLRDERAAWEARLAAAQRENDALRDANGALRDEVAEHLAQLAAIEASESWRLTAPVRAVADAARRLTADARRRRERGRSA